MNDRTSTERTVIIMIYVRVRVSPQLPTRLRHFPDVGEEGKQLDGGSVIDV